MKFIDSSAKTNWKFIATVIVVGYVISGGLILLNLFLNSKKTQSAIDVFNQSGQPLQNVILKQGNKTQVVIPKSTTQQNPNSILTHDNSPCAFESLAYDYYLDTYIVKKGDTLLSISKSQSGSTSRVNELIQLNQEKYPSLSIANSFIEIGWQLFLPPKFQKSSTGKLFGLKGRIVDQNQSAFQIGTSSSMPVGSIGLLAFKKDTTKYFGKDKFEIGDCITIVFDNHSITLAISPQDKNYFKEAEEIDMSNWKTYTNTQLGISLSHPYNWTVKQAYETWIKLNPKGYSDAVIDIFLRENPNNLSLKDLDQRLTGASGIGPQLYSPNNKQVEMHSGITAYMGKCTIDGADPSEITDCEQYIIPHNQKVFQLRNVIHKSLPEQRKIFNQILSTFRFVE